MLVHKLLAISP